MNKAKKIWFNNKYISWDKAKIHVLTHALHYGSGVFEGIRCYETSLGPAVFRLDDHIKRFYHSAKFLKIKIPYSSQEMKEAVLKLIKINKVKNCYIRPICFYGYGKMGLDPDGAEINVYISLWEWPKYLKESVKVKISKFIRLHPQSVVSSAKVCGYYVNSIFATFDVKKEGYDEALLLDYRGFVAEGPGENIFMVKNKTLYTPKLGSILPGITRDTVIKIAKDFGYKVREKDIALKELFRAEELFFTGTAAEITPIIQINQYKKKIGEVSSKIRNYYKDIVTGKVKKYYQWLSFAN